MPGPVSGTGCAVCEHPEHVTINALLNEGTVSRRKIARDFGLGKDSVSRHCWKRHRGYDPKVPAARPDDESGEPLDERGSLVVQRGQLEQEMVARPRSDISRELRQVNARIAEIDGAGRAKLLSVEDVLGLPEQIARWLKALEPFPDARDAMLAATDPKLLGAERTTTVEPVAVEAP